MDIVYIVKTTEVDIEDRYQYVVKAFRNQEDAQALVNRLEVAENIKRERRDIVQKASDQWLEQNPGPERDRPQYVDQHLETYEQWFNRYNIEMHQIVLDLGIEIDHQFVESWLDPMSYDYEFFEIEECELE